MSHLQPYRCVQVASAGLFVLSVAVFLGGCRAAPHVAVIDQRLGEATAEAQRVEFVVELTNPGNVAIELRELHYRVRVAGGSAYTGRRFAQATLPAGGSVQVMMPAVIAHDDRQVDLDGAATYHVSGSVSFIRPGALARMLRDMGFPRPRVGFSGQGVIDG